MQAEWAAYTETRSGLLRARTLYEQAYTLWQLAGDNQRAGLVEADMVSNVRPGPSRPVPGSRATARHTSR